MTQLEELMLSGTADSAATDSIAAKMQPDWSMIKNMSLDDVIQKIVSSMVEFAFHLAIAIVVFYVGKFIINKIYKVVDAVFIRRRLDRSLATFILSLIRIVLYFILIVTVVGILGIETSSFLALFASAGVAIGLALSGTLQNFAGGVLILLLKPYRIGDYIEAQGFAGTVKEIQIFSTIINTADNKQIIIPNGPLSTSSINNYSKEDYRRVDWTVSIAYGDSFADAKAAILDILLSDDRVVKGFIEDDRTERAALHAALAEGIAEEQEQHDAEAAEEAEEKRLPWWRRLFLKKKVLHVAPSLDERYARLRARLPKKDGQPFVALSSLGSSSVDLTVRAWVPSSLYWAVYFDMNRRFYDELPSHGINFPFPQLDVHLNPGSN